MSLKPEVSLGVGLATAALVYGTYQHFMPSVIDVRAGAQNDPQVSKTERTAAWTTGAMVAGISLLAKDATVAILGGAMVVILSWTHRHANLTHPDLAMAVPYSIPPQAAHSDAYHAEAAPAL